jgi:hypothetical protein
MACFYCHKQKITSPAHGNCAECKLPVCTSPSTRKDKVFHASRCRCQCQELVCRYDTVRHAASEGGLVTSCFPSSAIACGSTAISAAVHSAIAQRTAERLDPGAVESFNTFLNFVSPGHFKLAVAIARRRDTALDDVTELKETESGEKWIAFAPEFFNEGTMDRLVVLAVHSSIQAWEVVDHMPKHPNDKAWLEEVGWIEATVYEQLWAGLHSIRANDDLPHTFLDPFAPPGSTVPATLRRALTYTGIPDSAEDIADWMIELPVPQIAW